MKKAFSLIEVLIFVSVLTLFFVLAVSVTTASLRNMKISEHRIKAVHYAEEMLAWLRSYKEMDWQAFTEKVDNITCTALTYCFNTITIPDFTSSAWPASGACSDTGLNPAIYKREIVLEPEFSTGQNCGDSLSQVKVRINVKWSELNNNYEIPITTILSVWEN